MYGQALRHFDEALTLNPELCSASAKVCNSIGAAHLETGDLKKAASYFRKALIQDAEDPVALKMLARIQKKLKAA